MEFRILGPVEAYNDDRSIELGGRKQRALLGALLLHTNEVVSSDRLIEELWGEHAPASAAKLVQGYVVGLRRTLGAEAVVTRASGYLLPVADDELDVLEFTRLTEEARALPSERAADKLRAALALWRGPVLADVPLQGPAQHEAERLNELRLEALTDRVEADLACGRHRELVAELETLAAEHPLRERPRAQLMLALYRSGRQAEALVVYRQTRHVLTDELGIDPSRELRALEQAILNQDPALGAPAAPPRVAANLPRPPTPLIGREWELTEASALLREHRLLTLTGPGGSGKTRLALELAGIALADFPDGVHWVPLQALRDPELVLPTIEQATGARGELANHLRDKHLLLVLDNFEQLLPAPPKLADLLGAAPHLKFLVTSRQRLHLAAEHEYPVAPLQEQEAVELFAERARAVKPDFVEDAAVAALCRRLDCLPLAVELAAARVRALEPAVLLQQRFAQRLPLLTGGPRDAPERQQTMRATINWSYDLLGDELKQLFARLAVFVGGCTFEAAEEACGADLDALEALVEQNLLRREAGRFHMLEVIREYALERLDESGQASELRSRHARFYLAHLEQLDTDARTPRPPMRVLRETFEPERANSLAALEHFRRERDHESEARLAATVVWVDWAWNPEEGRRWLGDVLTYTDVPAAVRARVLWAASRIARNQGDYALDTELNDELLAIWRALDAKQLIVRTLARLVISSIIRGDRGRARKMLQEAEAIALELGTDITFGMVAMAEAVVALYTEQLDEARTSCERALGRFRQAEAPLGITSILTYLGAIALAQARHDAARSFRESLLTRRRANFLWTSDFDLEGLAGIAAARGEPAVAASLLGAAEATRETSGSGQEPFQVGLREGTQTAIQRSLDFEGRQAARAEGRAMSVEAAVKYALANVD